jgi:hypothetical protein
MSSTSNPQPMQVRRGGAKRGDHGTYLAARTQETEHPQPPAPTPSVPISPIGTDPTSVNAFDTIAHNPVQSDPILSNDRNAQPSPPYRPTDAAARAKAAYDAKPKVIFRGVDEIVNGKLRAIYKHQLHQPGGVEGWSEWGRLAVLEAFIAAYERENGKIDADPSVQLKAGRTSR